jgi:hypothetical protein
MVQTLKHEPVFLGVSGKTLIGSALAKLTACDLVEAAKQ